MIRLTTLGIVGALALCLASCSGTPPGEFVIIQNQVPNADCSIPATKGALYRGEGFLDVSVGGGYELFPLLENDFPGPSGGTNVDANRIVLSGFDVDVGLPDNPVGPIATLIQSLRDAQSPVVQFSTLTSGSVASGGGNTASFVGVLPSDLASMIHSMKLLPNKTDRYWVMVSVRARGGTLVGKVRSDAFKYPIELCDGCLVLNLGECTPSAPLPASCTPGQDGEALGCCDLAGQLVCQ